MPNYEKFALFFTMPVDPTERTERLREEIARLVEYDNADWERSGLTVTDDYEFPKGARV